MIRQFFLDQLILTAILAAGIAGLVTNLLVPLAAKLAVAIKVLDYPGHRKRHPEPIPRLGGIAIVAGLAFGATAMVLPMWREWRDLVTGNSVIALILGTSLVFLTGVVDDLVGLSASKKLLVEALAASFIVFSGWQFDVLGVPGGAIQLGAFGGTLTVLWIVGVTNAINLIDGLDGLASGVVAIIGVSFMIYSLAYDRPLAVVLIAALVGSCLGFLPHNWEPARIFMGDAGSLTLGYLLGTMSVYATIKSPAAVAILVPILALGVPVIDTLLVMLLRFLERPKGRFFRRFLRIVHADRNHLHHLLESLVTSRRSIVRWIYFMVAVSCAMALIVALTKQSGLGIVLLVVELGAIVVVREMGMARQAQSISRRHRKELDEELRTLPEVEEDQVSLPGKEPLTRRGDHIAVRR